MCLFFFLFSTALQPNLLSFPQQQGSLLLSQPGPSLASQVRTQLRACQAAPAAPGRGQGTEGSVPLSAVTLSISSGRCAQAVGRSGLPGSSVEPHLDVPQHLQVAKHLTPAGASEEPSDLEELEKFAKTFKQRRIKLGFTQVRGKAGLEKFGLFAAFFSKYTETNLHYHNLDICTFPSIQGWGQIAGGKKNPLSHGNKSKATLEAA